MADWLQGDKAQLKPAGERFRALLAGKSIIRAPGAHNALAGLIAREAGFDEISLSSRVAPLVKIVSRGDTTVRKPNEASNMSSTRVCTAPWRGRRPSRQAVR